MNNFKGEVIRIFEPVQISDKFTSQKIHVQEFGATYPNVLEFQANNDKIELLKNAKVGEIVDVGYFTKGRSWTNPKDDKIVIFMTLEVYKFATVLAAGQNG